MMVDFTVLTHNAGAIAGGFAVTLETWLAGTCLGMAAGLAMALLLLGGGRWTNRAIRLYIEVIRGTPFLVQLFFLYYGGPSIGLDLEPVTAGILGLGLYGSAYFAEVFRAGFGSIPKGHLEAGTCLGLTRWQMVRRIMLPQMLVIIVPSAVQHHHRPQQGDGGAVRDHRPGTDRRAHRRSAACSFAFLEVLVALCLGYLALVELTAGPGRWAERKVGRLMIR